MSNDSTRCPKAPSCETRHKPHYDNGALVTTDTARLKATCQFCGASIGRVHSRSAWWRTGLRDEGER